MINICAWAILHFTNCFPWRMVKEYKDTLFIHFKITGYHPMMRVQYTCSQKCPINCFILYWKYSFFLLKLLSIDWGIISWAALIKAEDVPKVMLVWNWNHILNSPWGMRSPQCRFKWKLFIQLLYNIWNFSVGLGWGCATAQAILKGFSKKCRQVLCEICGWGRRAFEDEDKIP